MDNYHPDLPPRAAWTLDVILQNMAQDPHYLDGAPYTSDEIAILQKYAAPATETAEDDEMSFDGESKWERLERESNKLLKMLTGFSAELDNKDNTEKMAYFRTATSLLDKIVGIQERTANLKQISMFHDTVLLVMEDVLEPGQRTEVMEQLRKAINPEA